MLGQRLGRPIAGQRHRQHIGQRGIRIPHRHIPRAGDDDQRLAAVLHRCRKVLLLLGTQVAAGDTLLMDGTGTLLLRVPKEGWTAP